MTSLLGHPTDISMRPNLSIDKEISAVDLDQFFEDYVETDLLHQLPDGPAEQSSSDDLAHLFELAPSNANTSALPNWEAPAEDAWHKAMRKLEQSPASPVLNVSSPLIYPQSHGKASLSNPEFFCLDDLFEPEKAEPKPRSQPSTPKQHTTRPAKEARSSPDRSLRHGTHKIKKKPSVPNFADKMMRPSHFRAGFQDIWARKLDHAAHDTFTLQMPPNGAHSPPPSTKLLQEEAAAGFFPRESQPYTISMSSPLPNDNTTPDIQQSNYQLTPLSSPTIDVNSRNGQAFQFSNDGIASAYISHLNGGAALSALQTPPPSHRLSMTPWGSDASPNLDFSFSASTDYQSTPAKSNGWWNGTEPSPPSTYQSSHSRSGSQSMSFSTANVAGLGISCDTASFSGFGSELAGDGGGVGASASFDMSKYAPLYPHAPGIPIGHTPARSRSPSLSPQPRFTRRRHSSQQNLHSHHHRQSQSRRKSSNSSSHSTGRQSGSGSVGFVNFTPDDSRKILTGVAPSGSSKTKARREKEAADKRRKLSQAAMKAVIEAGGDLGKLEKEGLLILEG